MTTDDVINPHTRIEKESECILISTFRSHFQRFEPACNYSIERALERKFWTKHFSIVEVGEVQQRMHVNLIDLVKSQGNSGLVVDSCAISK